MRLSTKILLVVLMLIPCVLVAKERHNKEHVTITAYNSVRSQTDGNPTIAAWGDRLKPGMKVVAVSHDLMKRGLTRGKKIKIKGLKGQYVVLDRMSKRWKKRIDIYMGNNVRKARRWGRQRRPISWVN
jgi:3D (Asp-Asp-Asp) domain-containing protein